MSVVCSRAPQKGKGRVFISLSPLIFFFLKSREIWPCILIINSHLHPKNNFLQFDYNTFKGFRQFKLSPKLRLLSEFIFTKYLGQEKCFQDLFSLVKRDLKKQHHNFLCWFGNPVCITELMQKLLH